MIKAFLTTMKRKWYRVAGSLAVLLMFYVPITRAVLAGSRTAANAAAPASGVRTSKATRAGASGTGPTTPRNPSPRMGTGKGTGHSAATRSGGSGHHTGHKSGQHNKPAAM